MTRSPSLIVNADDYGYTRAVSAGIRSAFNGGIVTSTSVLIVTPSARSDLREAQASCSGLGVGVHLTLSGRWSPILGTARVPSLTTKRGTFPSGAELTAAIDRVQPEQVFAEWRAQIEAVIDAGVSPDHLDAHHHVAYRSRALIDVLFALAEQYALPVRLPVSTPIEQSKQGSVPQGEDLVELAAARGIAHPTYLLSGFDDDATRAGLLALLGRMQPGDVAELTCHPGRIDWRLRFTSSLVRGRHRQIAVLTDEEVRQWVRANDVNLTTFAAIGGPRALNAAGE